MIEEFVTTLGYRCVTDASGRHTHFYPVYVEIIEAVSRPSASGYTGSSYGISAFVADIDDDDFRRHAKTKRNFGAP